MMKLRLLAATLMAFMFMGLAACNAEDDPEETAAPDPPGEQPPPDEPPEEEEPPPPPPEEPPPCEDEDCRPLPQAMCAPQADFLPVIRGADGLNAMLFVSTRVRGRCDFCETGDPELLLNDNLLDSARMLLPADRGHIELTIYSSHPARGVRRAGFMVADTEGALSRRDRGLRIELLRYGRIIARGELDDDEVTLFDTGDSLRQLVMLEVEEERFDAIRLRVEARRDESRTLDVYAACVDRYGW